MLASDWGCAANPLREQVASLLLTFACSTVYTVISTSNAGDIMHNRSSKQRKAASRRAASVQELPMMRAWLRELHKHPGMDMFVHYKDGRLTGVTFEPTAA